MLENRLEQDGRCAGLDVIVENGIPYFAQKSAFRSRLMFCSGCHSRLLEFIIWKTRLCSSVPCCLSK